MSKPEETGQVKNQVNNFVNPDIPSYEVCLIIPIEQSCEFCIRYHENNDDTYTCEKFDAPIVPNGRCPYQWEGHGIEPKG